MSIARYQKFGQIRNPKGCNTLPWVRRSEKEKLETAVREKRCHLREQIRNSVSRQKGIGSDKVTTLSVPRNMWEWSCQRGRSRETYGNILSTKGLKRQLRKKFQTSDSVIQLAKEEFIYRVVLNPMDNQSSSHLQKMNIFNLSSNFDNLKLFQIRELGIKHPSVEAGVIKASCLYSPRHSSWAGLAVNPSLHSQVQLPRVLRQRPFSQIPGLV